MSRGLPGLLVLAASLALVAGATTIARGGETPSAAPAGASSGAFVPSAERGLRHLLEKSYVPPMLDEQDFDRLPTTWPSPAREAAEKADARERRRLAFARYGLCERPGDASGKPLQFAVDDEGRWSLNCLACHSGCVEGKPVAGAANAEFAFQDLVDDVVRLADRGEARTGVAARLWKRIPLGESHGTTNAVAFALALGVFRDKDLALSPPRAPLEPILHHDLDAPAWWNVRLRAHLYVDGATKKSHRALMQFLMVPQNGPDKFRAWEDDFRDILAYVESLRPPAWPHAVDRPLAERGRGVFEATCARCHGTYGPSRAYPALRVPIAEVGTDRTRLDAISRRDRERYAVSWFTGYRPDEVDLEPGGYVAPPLDGVWASAPYFHNGSAPTLWHVLHPDARPAAWQRRRDAGRASYDRVRVGLDVESRDEMPAGPLDAWERRSWFDTRARGKSAAGHTFPGTLSEDERRAVLEYLKTL
jgi:cytochrome c5